MLANIIFHLLRFGIGVLFLYAGILKAWDPAGFLIDIQNYRILSYQFAVALALFLPWLEICCGVSIMIRRFQHGALFLLLILMLIFMGGLISAWVRDLDISCGCFGKTNHKVSFSYMILRDCGILAMIGIVASKEWKKVK